MLAYYNLFSDGHSIISSEKLEAERIIEIPDYSFDKTYELVNDELQARDRVSNDADKAVDSDDTRRHEIQSIINNI